MDSLRTLIDFFKTLESRLIIAAIIMVIISALSLYIVITTSISIQKRRQAIRVSLPELDDNKRLVSSKSAFYIEDNLEVEIVEQNEDVVEDLSAISDNNYFTEALTMESKQYIPLVEIDVDMPKIEEVEKILKQEKLEEAKKKQEENQQHLKEIAKADSADTDISKLDNFMNMQNEGENK